MVETGSETEEDDKLAVSEEDPLINGTGSPASLTNPEASPRAESHGLLTKDEEDDEMRDSGVEHIWPDNDMLSASVDGTGECRLQTRVGATLAGALGSVASRLRPDAGRRTYDVSPAHLVPA